MKASMRSRAVAAAKSIAAGCGLPADDAIVVHDSNKLSLHLRPCDSFARVAHAGVEQARFEVDVAQALAASEGCPVAALDPRVPPRVHEQDGFAVTLWTWYSQTPGNEVAPADSASALHALHAAMRGTALESPHFTDRVAEAQELVSSGDRTPRLGDAERELVANTLESLCRSIRERGAAEQLLHGEPHSGNLLASESGPRFIDLETCCRGPVEFDLAHVPEEVADLYPNVDEALLGDARGLVIAMVAAWRFDVDDELPDGRREGRRLLGLLREGPPWRTLDD